MLQLLMLVTGLGVGAFVGAQTDDLVETTIAPPAAQKGVGSIDPLKVAIYAAGGMTLFWVAKKTGTIDSVLKVVK